VEIEIVELLSPLHCESVYVQRKEGLRCPSYLPRLRSQMEHQGIL